MSYKRVGEIDFSVRINGTPEIFVHMPAVLVFFLVVIWYVTPCTRPNNNRIRFGFGYLSILCTKL